MRVRQALGTSFQLRSRRLVAIATSAFLIGGGAAGIVATSAARASADTIGPINFESGYSNGSVNGQDGWTSTGSYDQAVVNTAGFAGGASFGTKTFRISDQTTSGSFGDQTFSKPTVNAAGEPGADTGGFSAGTLQNNFSASFDFSSATFAGQAGTPASPMEMSVSPDRGDGARMSYVRLQDDGTSWSVYFDDYVDQAPLGTDGNLNDGCSGLDDFRDVQIATGLSLSAVHNIRFDMNLVPGAENDVVTVSVDGVPKITGTSWEDYYRFCAESGGGTGGPLANQTRIARNLLFRMAGDPHPTDAGEGFLIDNISIATANDCTTNCFADAVKGHDGATGQSGDPVKTIQEAVNLVSAGGTVHVAAGTYVENVTVPKGVVIVGAGANNTFVEPATSAPQCNPVVPDPTSSLCPGASVVFLIQASNVTVASLTVDGDNPALSGFTAGGANIDARDGIETDFHSGTFNNLTVLGVTVKNIYERGIEFTDGTGFLATTDRVDNVLADSAGESIGIDTDGGAGVVSNNVISHTSAAIATNHSTGTQMNTNVITTSDTGVHSDNNGDSGGSADSITGNTVTCNPGGSGVFVFVPYFNQTVSGNTVSGCDTGLAEYGSCNFSSANQCAGGVVPTVTFTNNSSTGNTNVGLLITTDTLGFGQAQVKVSADHNTLSGAGDTGVSVVENAPSTATAALSRNSIAGNSASGVTDAGTTLVQAGCNWWGAANGPGPVGPGSGDKVSTNVAFQGWLTSSNLNGSCGFAPTLTSVSSGAGGTGIVVYFTPAANSGPPRSFTATCVSLDGHPTISATGAGSPITVTGAASNHPYQCTVTETNPTGTSAPSNTSAVVWPGAVSGQGGGSIGDCPEGALNAPTMLSTAPGNASATVSWAPPTTGCVAGFIVTPYIGTIAQPATLIPGHGTTTVIRGLVNGTTYTFTVAAENGSSAGPASAHSGPTTVGAPAAATFVKAARISKGIFKLTFTAPKSNGAAIKSYTATCSSTNGGKKKAKTASRGPITAYGLTAGKVYTCTVKATNSRGAGPASHPTKAMKA